MKLHKTGTQNFPPTLMLNWVSFPLSFFLSSSTVAATYIFTPPTCTTSIITLPTLSLNAEFQYFIQRFNKISLLLGHHWKRGEWVKERVTLRLTLRKNMTLLQKNSTSIKTKEPRYGPRKRNRKRKRKQSINWVLPRLRCHSLLAAPVASSGARILSSGAELLLDCTSSLVAPCWKSSLLRHPNVFCIWERETLISLIQSLFGCCVLLLPTVYLAGSFSEIHRRGSKGLVFLFFSQKLLARKHAREYKISSPPVQTARSVRLRASGASILQ